MATPDLTAAQVMNAAASALNDTARSTYTYTVQIPYLNMALRELQEIFEEYEIPVASTVTGAAINIPTGEDHMEFDGVAPTPALPDDLVEPQALWVSPEGEDLYIGPIPKVKILPRYLEGVDINFIDQFVWESQQIKFFAATVDLDVKIDYIKNLFSEVTHENDELNVINAQTFLQYRTAALVAEFVEENKIRADTLNGFAGTGLDRVLGIGTKGKQASMTRRRPFRLGYKQRW